MTINIIGVKSGVIYYSININLQICAFKPFTDLFKIIFIENFCLTQDIQRLLGKELGIYSVDGKKHVVIMPLQRFVKKRHSERVVSVSGRA